MPLQITILGLDAVGASLGIALGTLDPKALDVGRPVITGWDPDRKAMSEARGRLAVDQVQADLATAVRDADVIFVAVPYAQMHDVFETIGSVLKHGAIVTDTAATKSEVIGWASRLLPTTVEFVGGHPMAALGGSTRDGKQDAFKDVIYALVPLPRTSQNALDGVETLVRAIGAKPYYIDAAEHDTYVAAAAHLPLVLSVALMDTLSQSGGWRELQPISGEALLRMTELAGGDPKSSAEALRGNAPALISWLDRVTTTLIDMRRLLADPAATEALLERAAEARDEWVRSEPNLRPGEEAFLGNTSEVDRSAISGLFFGRRPGRDRSKRR
jgi:prephenate dehydrogenase